MLEVVLFRKQHVHLKTPSLLCSSGNSQVVCTNIEVLIYKKIALPLLNYKGPIYKEPFGRLILIKSFDAIN